MKPYERASRITKRFGPLSLLAVVCFGAGGCTEPPFALQDAAIEVRVTGIPNDPSIIVTAFVQDQITPFNRDQAGLAMGGSTTFGNLGAGFKITVGVEGLSADACTVIGWSATGSPGDGGGMGASTANSHTITTRSSVTTIVTFELQCATGRLELHVNGLPAGDSAWIFVHHDSLDLLFQSVRVTNGVQAIALVPHFVTLDPLGAIGRDRKQYRAPEQSVVVRSRHTTAVTVHYQAVDPAAHIVIAANGLPGDSLITFSAFVRDRNTPFRGDSTVLPLGSSVGFTNVGAGRDVDVGIDGLSKHACSVLGSSQKYSSSSNSAAAPLLTQPGITDTVTFTLRCSSGVLDLQVSGLPPSDSARVALRSPFDSLMLWVRNGMRRVNVLPFVTWQIVPNNVQAADERVYRAAAQTVGITSRQTTTASIQYTASACAYFQPIAWYRFDAGSAFDASGNANHGMVQGSTPVNDRFGISGAALSLDGVDDSIELGDRFNTLLLPFSIAAWVYQPAAARNELRSIFVSDDEPGRYAGIWFQTEPTGSLQITYADGGAVGAATRRTISSNNPIPADTWVHVAATVRGPTDMTLYVNGAAVPGTYSGTGGPLLHTAAPARIGSMTIVPGNRPWLGNLDEVRVYDCSLVASEVALLFTQR